MDYTSREICECYFILGQIAAAILGYWAGCAWILGLFHLILSEANLFLDIKSLAEVAISWDLDAILRNIWKYMGLPCLKPQLSRIFVDDRH